LRRRARTVSTTAERNRAACAAEPEQRARRLLLAGSLHASETDDLASVKREIDGNGRLSHGEPPYDEQGLSNRGGAGRIGELDGAADHHRDKTVRRSVYRLDRADDLAVLQYRDAI
jgi:hypothetical protein